MACKNCLDFGFIYVNGEKRPCPCSRAKKLKAYFPAVDLDSVEKGSLSRLLKLKTIADSRISKNSLIITDLPEKELNLLILLHLISWGTPSYMILNAYELVDIFLGKHPSIPTILSINPEILVVLYGYHEFTNIRQNDFLLQLFDHMKRLDRPVLFVSRISIDSGPLYLYMKENSWHVSNTDTRKSSSLYRKEL